MASRFEEQPEQPQGKVLFYGDSDISHWDVRKAFPSAAKCGVSGATCEEAAAYAARARERFAPLRVVFVAGENDLAQGRSPAEVFAAFRMLHSALAVPMLYLTCKPEPATSDLHAAYREYDALVREYAEEEGVLPDWQTESLKVLDSWAPLLGEDGGGDSRFFARDGLHLSAAGYALWDDLVTAALTADATLPSDAYRD